MSLGKLFFVPFLIHSGFPGELCIKKTYPRMSKQTESLVLSCNGICQLTPEWEK